VAVVQREGVGWEQAAARTLGGVGYSWAGVAQRRKLAGELDSRHG